MHILVAEDEPAIADFIEHGLNAEGYAVTVTGDGEEALQLATAHDFGMIVLDRMLPGRDGIAVLRELRKVKPDVRVIMLTARTDIDDRVEGLDAGAVDYMPSRSPSTSSPRACAPTCVCLRRLSRRGWRRSGSSSTCSRAA
jgi:DNA-binding response OmpR family regulator